MLDLDQLVERNVFTVSSLAISPFCTVSSTACELMSDASVLNPTILLGLPRRSLYQPKVLTSGAESLSHRGKYTFSAGVHAHTTAKLASAAVATHDMRASHEMS